MTTPRDAFTAQCYEAITRLRQDITDGVWRPTADNTCVDRLLKAWEKSLIAAARAQQQAAHQRREQAMQPILQAVSRIKAGAAS